MNQSTATVPAVSGSGWTVLTIVVAITLLSVFSLTDSEQQVAVSANDNSGPVTDAAGPDLGPLTEEGSTGGSRRVVRGGQAGTAGSAGSEGLEGGSDGTSGAAGQYNCAAGQNAGKSDIGVTANEIRFGATVARTGIAESFLADAQHGIEAVLRKVNAAGGVCGRQIHVSYEDDAWDQAAGQRIIEKWIGEKQHFGLAVNPSSEGLRGAIKGGLIEQSGFPVVGADGMLIGQYQSPWVWPVATSTHSVMHIMADHAYSQLKAKTFAIVYEGNYRFGVEGEAAFSGAVNRLKAADGAVQLKKALNIQGGALSYKNEVDEFVNACTQTNPFDQCDFVAVLLEPSTAAQWVADGGLGSGKEAERPAKGIGAPQPLFVNSFIRDCKAPCAGLIVWTSFKPPLAPFDTDAAVAEYVNDLRAVSSKADASNPHVQGAYVGMKLLVEALERVGAEPTRAALREVLDQTTFESGLAPPLTFAPGDHFAAVNAQAFEAVFNVSTFVTWRYTGSGFIEDRQVKQDIKND